MIRSPEHIIVAIERECLIADRAINELRWDDCQTSWAAQAKLAHELEIALRDVPRADAAFARVQKKIDRIVQYRDGQIKRLRALGDEITDRLGNIEQFRAFSKTLGRERPAALLDVTT